MKAKKRLLSIITSVVMFTASVLPSTRANAAEDQIKVIMDKMSLEEKVGQMFMPDFRNWNGKPYTEMNTEVAKIIQDYHLGGVILFRENVANTEQTVKLVDGLQKASKDIPLLVTIDQEGGLVTRLQTGTNMPGNMALGATRDPKIAEQVGQAIGEELNSLGINVNFAPSMDVNVNPDNPVIGIRSFGSDPQLVADMGVGYIKGLQNAKVAATAKHFPGHGDTATDSHVGLPIVEKDIKELEKTELKPFQAAMDNNIDMIMTAHIVVPALDNTKAISKKDNTEIGIPATLSKKILTDLIRNKMNYKGVVVTDALNMKAIVENFGEEDTVIRAINAGADIVLMPAIVQGTDQIKNLDKVYNAAVEAVKSGKIPEERVNESVRRILKLKIDRNIIENKDSRTLDQKIADAKKVVGSEAHKKIEKNAAEKAVTLIKNDNNILPFNLENNKKVLLAANLQSRLNLMELSMNSIIKDLKLSNIKVDTMLYNSTDALKEEDKKKLDEADYIVLSTMNANGNAKFVQEATKYAADKNKDLVVMSTRNPYDIAYLPDAKANIAVYGSSGYDQTQQGEAALPINIPAGMEVIFGLVNPTGKLPVSIPTADRKGTLYAFGHGLSYIDEEAIKEAEEAVVKAEKSLNREDLENAIKLSNGLADSEKKQELLARLNKVEEKIKQAEAAKKAEEEAKAAEKAKTENKKADASKEKAPSKNVAGTKLPKTGEPIGFAGLMVLGSLASAAGVFIRKK